MTQERALVSFTVGIPYVTDMQLFDLLNVIDVTK